MELIDYLAVLGCLYIGFIIGLMLAEKLARYRLKQMNRRLVEQRLAELSNGRKTEHLTVDPELLS